MPPWAADSGWTVFCPPFRRLAASRATSSTYRLSLARARVEVQQRFDGTIAIYRNETCLITRLLEDPPDSYRIGKVSRAAVGRPAQDPKNRPVEEPVQP